MFLKKSELWDKNNLIINFYSVAETILHKDHIENLELEILFKPVNNQPVLGFWFHNFFFFFVNFITENVMLSL